MTPLEIAGAYTIFANGGELVQTSYIKNIRDQQGDSIFESKAVRKQVIDPRVAYLVENMMEEVLRSGTGAGVHAKGFNLPAAGKTGTSRDGWFAGFTSKLICVVWVGFDDNRDFKLEGAHSALPIWAEFMKHAHQHREYRAVHSFEPPEGIITVDIDADNGLLATGNCPKIRSQPFISGTQPVDVCRIHGGNRTQVAGWETSQPVLDRGERAPVFASTPSAPVEHNNKTVRSIPVTPAEPEPAKPRKGLFGRLKDAL